MVRTGAAGVESWQVKRLKVSTRWGHGAGIVTSAGAFIYSEANTWKNTRMTIRAFIFDLDGVITDTAEFHYRAWKQLAEAEHIPFTRADNDALRGVSRRESLRRLLNGRDISESLAGEWLSRKNAHYLEYINRLTPQDRLPGVTAFLDAARNMSLKLGIASASKNARLVLERLELTGHFEVIGDGPLGRQSQAGAGSLSLGDGSLGGPPVGSRRI